MVYAKASVTLSATTKVLNVGKDFELTLKGATKGSWSVSDKNIATIKKVSNTKYKVTAKKKGTTTVNVKVGTKKYSCKVIVESPKLNISSHTMHIDQSVTLKVIDTTQKVTWSTSNKSIATVNNGKVTAKKKGTATISAKVNGTILKCKITVKNHSYKKTINTTTKNCVETIITVKSCDCGKKTTTTKTATRHTYETVTNNATCTESGSEEVTCKVCGSRKSFKTTSKLGHNYVINKTDATCEKEGEITYQCTRCKDKYIQTLSKISHKYKIDVTVATCTTDGSKKYTCSVCNDTYSEVLPATGHGETVSKVIREATSTDSGLMATYCKNCMTLLKLETIPAN
jgi:hypothetical protein